ncbi:MAG: PAS domain-containing protein [Clostridia bacterium]|nr:PAS domain-containing protein [Clostridia bacterium]
MQKTLKKKMTASLLLTALAVMAIVSVCLLLGMARYSSAQFEDEVADVLTVDLLTEMNDSATGTADSAAYNVEQILEAYAAQLRFGMDRNYSIWDAATGELVGGAEDAAMTDNIVTAMNGEVGDAFSLLPSQMDVAIPVTGEAVLVVDISDDGSTMYAMFGNMVLFLTAALVLSLIMCLILSRIFAGAFTDSAMQAAREIRESDDSTLYPAGDWEAMATAMYAPAKKKKKKDRTDRDALNTLLPFLREGYVRFHTDGKILEINEAAEALLGVSFDEDAELTFEKTFHNVPMPTESQSMVRGRLNQNGQTLEVVFVALEPDDFAAVLYPVDGRKV